MLSVLHLTTESAGVSGAERILLNFAEGSDRGRWKLAFATLRSWGPLNDLLAQTGWPTYDLGVEGAASLPASCVRLAALLRRLRPDVLHVHLSSALVGAAVAPLVGVPLVQTRHYVDEQHTLDRQHRFRRRGPIDGWAARRCLGIATVSEASRDVLTSKEHVPAERVRVIENGIDIDGLANLDCQAGREGLTRLGVPQGPIVGCAATFRPEKGHPHLLDAWVQVRRQIPDAQLVLFGADIVGQHNEPALRAQAAAAGITNSVHFLGYRQEDTHALMAGFDVYVQPALKEAFGLSVIEAMALGLPVVCSDVGGMRRTVEAGATGLRVPPADPGALAEALVALLRDPERRARFGRAGVARAQERYSLRRMLDEYDRWYVELGLTGPR